MSQPDAYQFWVSAAEAAQLLSVNEKTIYYWLNIGELIGVNLAKNLDGKPHWKIARTEIERFRTARTAFINDPR